MIEKEALASWAAGEEIGRHLTGEEVRAWIWASDEERLSNIDWIRHCLAQKDLSGCPERCADEMDVDDARAILKARPDMQ